MSFQIYVQHLTSAGIDERHAEAIVRLNQDVFAQAVSLPQFEKAIEVAEEKVDLKLSALKSDLIAENLKGQIRIILTVILGGSVVMARLYGLI